MKLTSALCLSTILIFSSGIVNRTYAFTIRPSTIAAVKDTCDSAGVFLTHEDYLNRKLTCKVNPNRKGQKFTLSLNKKDIKITRPDTNAVFKAGSVYGFYQCGEKYRYSKKAFYNIVERSPMVIYTTTESNYSGLTEVRYYYSLKSDTEIRSLSLKNIEEDFKKFPGFITEVKNRFKWWSGLAATDEKGKLLINELWGEYKYRNE